MPGRRVGELTAILAMVLVWGEAGAHATGLLEGAGATQSAPGYDEQVVALREAFSAERKRLGLSAAASDTTPELHLGRDRCRNMAGGGSAGAGGSGLPAAGSASCTASSQGAPVWMVNMATLNLYMEDTPLWYSPPVGPAVEIKLSYNSGSPYWSPFSSKWHLNYGSYLRSYVGWPYPWSEEILIVMPDGSGDLYFPDGVGGYSSPNQVFNTLTRIAPNHFQLAFPDGTVYLYNIPPGTASSVSRLVEIRDAHGQKLTFGYDAGGNLATLTDATGKITTFSYTAGLLTRVTDPFGRSALFEHEANGNLKSITDMGGYGASFTYDLKGNPPKYYLSSMTNPAGSTWNFYFEPADGIPNGNSSYPPPGTAMNQDSRLTITDPSGGREEYYLRAFSSGWHVNRKNYLPYTSPTSNNYASNVPREKYSGEYLLPYDSVLDFFSLEISSVATPDSKSVQNLTYDNKGNVAIIRHPSMGDTHLTHNFMGNVLSVEGGYYPATSMTYASNGVDLTGITTGLGTVAVTYNDSHDMTSVTDRSGNKWTFAYNSLGQKISSTDPLGVETNYSYDSDHNLLNITSQGRTLKSYSYDLIGRIRTYTDSTGMTRSYDYNELNDITKITYPDNRHESITYSSSIPHLITSATDRSGKTTSFFYDASKLLTQVLNPEGGTIKFKYDANGNMAEWTDHNGNVTRFDYNNDNSVVKKSFADGTFTSFTYDEANRLATLTDARRESASHDFDLQGNLVEIGYAHATLPTPTVNYGYDAYNRRTVMAQQPGGAGTYGYTYDADSRLTSIDGPLVNDTITFEYDKKGRTSGYLLQGGQSVTYTYDALDRLLSIGSAAGTFTYSYTGASPVVEKLTRPNGSYTEYRYDSMNRLTLLSNKKSTGAIINQYAYSYNAQDLRASETITKGAPLSSVVSGTTRNSYDEVNELLKSTNPARAYAYDPDGNMTGGGYTPAGDTFTAEYDAESRLALIRYRDNAQLNKQVQYIYNGSGMLAKKKMGSTSVNYVLNDTLPLQERDGSNKVLREYTWGLNEGGGIGGLLGLWQGGKHYFYLYDGKGNVTALIDRSQAVVATYAYDPFGKLMNKTGALDQPYQFSTKQYDKNTGLSYYGYRFYAPSLGRWMTRDPLGEAGGLNLYGFALNNPANYVDPNGEFIPALIGIAAVVAYWYFDEWSHDNCRYFHADEPQCEKKKKRCMEEFKDKRFDDPDPDAFKDNKEKHKKSHESWRDVFKSARETTLDY